LDRLRAFLHCFRIAWSRIDQMSESAVRIKLAEADAMMKNGDKYCKKARLATHNHASIPPSNTFIAGLVQLEPRI
jgi:hypothetical protein